MTQELRACLHASVIVQTTSPGSPLAASSIMQPDNKTPPAKAPEHGAVRKHDRIAVTDEEDRAPLATYFDDDGNKVKDVEFVGARSPDADPDDSSLDPDADPQPEPRDRGERR
jgi:hypothetical protein